MKIKCFTLLQCTAILVVAWGCLCDGRKSNSKPLTSSRRRFDFCEGEDCHPDANQSEEDTGQDDEMPPYTERRRPGTAVRYRPSPSPSSYHQHRPESVTSQRYNNRSKGRRFKQKQYELDEDTIDDSIPDRHETSYDREDHISHQYHDHDYPRRATRVIDLPHTRKSYSSDEVPIPPAAAIDTSSVPLPNYDHRLPRSLEFDDHDNHHFDDDYQSVPRISHQRRNSPYEKEESSSGRGKGWSRSYWKKFQSTSDPNQSVLRIPTLKNSYNEMTDSSEGLDGLDGLGGYLQGIYGNSMPSSRSSSPPSSFPLTMDQMPLLDPQPALDKTLMESFLSSNQRLASLLTPESLTSNFNDATDQVSTSASSESSAAGSSGSSSSGSGGGSFRSFIPFGFSLSSLFGNTRYSAKGSDNERSSSDDDDEETSHNGSPGSCDSNESSDSRNSYKIVEPPAPSSSSTTTAGTGAVLTPTPAAAVPISAHPVTNASNHVITATTSEALKAKHPSIRKRFGFVTRSAAM